MNPQLKPLALFVEALAEHLAKLMENGEINEEVYYLCSALLFTALADVEAKMKENSHG